MMGEVVGWWGGGAEAKKQKNTTRGRRMKDMGDTSNGRGNMPEDASGRGDG